MRNLIRVLIVLAVLGAAVYGWHLWTRDTGDTGGGEAALTPEAAEQLGVEIGRQIGEEVGLRVAQETVARLEMAPGETTIAEDEVAEEEEVGEPQPAQIAEVPAPPPAAPPPPPAPEPAPAAPAPSEPAVVAAAPPPPPEPAAAEPAASPAPTETSAAEAEVSKKNLPKAEPQRPRAPLPSIVAWWGPTANSLPITSIGTATSSEGKLGLVVVGLNPFDAAQDFNANLRLADSAGQALSGQWALGKDPRMVYFFGLEIGRYQLTLGSGLSDNGGRKLGSDMSGPADVR